MKQSRGLIWLYGLALALGALVLQWLDYLYTVRRFSTEIGIVIVAALFTALGIWTGNRLTRSRIAPDFEKNTQALSALGISEREDQVLELLAKGLTNQQIADHLFVSLNTIKTHLSHLYQKLEVSNRTQAIHKARALRLIA